MTTRLLFVAILLLSATLSCPGQARTENPVRTPVVEPTIELRTSDPVVVVTVADEFVVLDEVASSKLVRNLNKNTRGVESVHVFTNGEDASRYGVSSQHVVVVVNYNLKVNLPWDLQQEFEKSKN